jgi:hypothetical protein
MFYILFLSLNNTVQYYKKKVSTVMINNSNFTNITKRNNHLYPLYLSHCVCIKLGKCAVMYLCIRRIDFASFCDISIWFWNCSDGVIFFVFQFICTFCICFSIRESNTKGGTVQYYKKKVSTVMINNSNFTNITKRNNHLYPLYLSHWTKTKLLHIPTENLKRFGGVQRSSFCIWFSNWKTYTKCTNKLKNKKYHTIMHNVQDYRILYYNAVRPAIC